MALTLVPIIRLPLPRRPVETRRKPIPGGSNAASLLHTVSTGLLGSGSLAVGLPLSKCHLGLTPRYGRLMASVQPGTQ